MAAVNAALPTVHGRRSTAPLTFFDILGKNEKLELQIRIHILDDFTMTAESIRDGRDLVPSGRMKVGKGVWRMPWLLQAMKDVISCDKPRGGANDP